MRQTAIAAFILGVCFSLSSQAWAQKCKPDFSYTDKLSKEKSDVWIQTLSSKGGLFSTSNVSISALVARQGNKNNIQLNIQKVERSATNQALESQYLAAVGKPFYFGFKSGEPLEFVVSEVANDSKANQGLFASKEVASTVMYTAIVSDKAMAALREALTSRQIEAVRITLAGNVRIEASVDDKNGQKMMEKFSCFYQSLDEKGIDLSSAVEPQGQAGKSASAGEKQAEPQKSATQLTIEQVIQMVAAKLADDIIISTIRNSSSKFDLTPDTLIKLKTAGVSDEVIRAMTK